MPRQSPSDSATLYKIGTTKIGNDGNLYKVIMTVNNKHRWVKTDKPSVKSSSKRSVKRSVKRPSKSSVKRPSKPSVKRSSKKTEKRSSKRSEKRSVKPSSKRSSKPIKIPKNKESLQNITSIEYQAFSGHKHELPDISVEFKSGNEVICGIYPGRNKIDVDSDNKYLNKFFSPLKKLKKESTFEEETNKLLKKLLLDDGKYMINLTLMSIYMDDEYNFIPIPSSVITLELNHVTCLNNALSLEDIMNVQHLIIDNEEIKGVDLLEIYNSIYERTRRFKKK